ncbi:MAG: Rieske 2Fe-2S domain-containing protein [Acidimicrobiales bacterium]|nr:ubiquinol-cytochrome c reductase iron-sulfur subunit [Acidimicrobiales bacterium]MCB1249914.1 ubiquinol-cytochrome c reductase iron-sulfur subunit [Acidimicrobiales bacterium]MCB1261665.1 ubiquinol-cytochrome c reductase iron-sulfur subunit [Acidimicrobiales bacterium]
MPDEQPQRRPGGGETFPAVAFALAIVAVIGFVAVYFGSADTQALGIFAFVCLMGIGVGMATWAKRFLSPAEPEVEDRGRLASTEEEIAAFHADFDAGEYQLERRSLLGKLLVGAVAATGLGALVPFLSLGPNPKSSFKETPWSPGARVVDEQGNPVAATSINTDGILTVFPEGQVGDEFAQTLLIGVRSEAFVPASGRESWTVDGVAAFSKVCTHAGCPVGLYQAAQGLLLCPCHQSTFDINNAAEPIFGPAAVPLPQLPLSVDADGNLVADGSLSAPPGPGFWNQNRQ